MMLHRSTKQEPDIDRLCTLLEAQTKAITELAESNRMLVQAMAEDDDDEGHDQYLDGSLA